MNSYNSEKPGILTILGFEVFSHTYQLPDKL